MRELAEILWIINNNAVTLQPEWQKQDTTGLR